MHAKYFASQGGIRCILHARECVHPLPAFNGLATLIMRHVMETEDYVIKNAMKKVSLNTHIYIYI